MTDTRTNEQISVAIAERLFGLECVGCWEEPLERCPLHGRERAPFASDHNAALGLVVPEMRRRGWHFTVTSYAGFESVTVSFFRPESWHETRESPDELPRAICLAAEAALDAERKAE